jgi:hypothetical protein
VKTRYIEEPSIQKSTISMSCDQTMRQHGSKRDLWLKQEDTTLKNIVCNKNTSTPKFENSERKNDLKSSSKGDKQITTTKEKTKDNGKKAIIDTTHNYDKQTANKTRNSNKHIGNNNDIRSKELNHNGKNSTFNKSQTKTKKSFSKGKQHTTVKAC